MLDAHMTRGAAPHGSRCSPAWLVVRPHAARGARRPSRLRKAQPRRRALRRPPARRHLECLVPAHLPTAGRWVEPSNTDPIGGFERGGWRERNSEALDSAHVRREVVVRGRRRSATRPRSISRRRRASARAGACTARLWRVCFRCGTQADILCAIIRARGRPSVRLAKPCLLHVLKRLVTCVL